MRPARLAALTAALLVLPATAAWAHPSFDPNAVPIGEPVETTLVVPHGCSTSDDVMPEEGQAVPTTRLDLQVVAGITIEPDDVDGWDAEHDGEAIVWTDAGGATTDPIELPVTLTVEEGRPGDQLLLSAYQECEDGSSYRWTEGSESTPPVRLELTEGETGTVETNMEGMSEMGTETEMGTRSEDMSASDDATAETDAQALAGEDDSGNGGMIAIVAGAVTLLVAGMVLRAKRNA